MGTIALWGANGAIGRSIAAVLRADGRPYRVVGRDAAALARTFGGDPLAEIVAWDPADPASVRAAAQGVETIVYLVGVDYTQFAQHPVLMRATLDGAIAAGVRDMLLIGTVYPYGRPRTTPVREDHPREPHTFKGRMRKAQEDLLLDADRAGRIRGAVLRLPDFYGPGVEKSLLGELFTNGANGKMAAVIGPRETPHEYIYVPDVGAVVVRLVDEPRAWGHVWHLGGAGTTTTRAMIDRVARSTGKPVRTLGMNAMMLRTFGLFNGVVRELVEMYYLATDPVVLDDSALHALLGPIRKTPYDDGVRATVAAARG
ncbi:MAG TPA: NAD-dependent epimerase/dehydratase family protein [Candidatus Sulfotelmatobacter sp.]|nr:NAD-dependent epimerase/dehydratase family protein [Candidatus Sulfotelmatobacter sp.]